MAIILPRVEKRPEYGFLSGLSSSLSQGLAGAAQSQFDQFQQRRQQEAKRESLRKLGVPESLSELVMNLSPAEQFEIVGNYLQGQQEQQPGQEFLGGLGEGLAPQPQQAPQQQGQVADILGALGGPQQAKGLEQLLSPQQQKQLRFQQQFGVVPQAAAPEASLNKAKEEPMQRQIQQLNPEQEFFNRLQRGRAGGVGLAANPKEQRAIRKEEREIRKEEFTRDKEAAKESKGFYKQTKDAARAAKNNDKRLNQMEKIVDSGKMSSAVGSAIIKFLHAGGYGPDLSSALNEATQDFDKLSTDFLKDAKAIFGSRITDVDLKNFLKTIPTSTQSKGSIKSVIKRIRSVNEAAIEENKAMSDVIKEHGGKRPANLEELVEERTGNKLDQLAKKFLASI